MTIWRRGAAVRTLAAVLAALIAGAAFSGSAVEQESASAEETEEVVGCTCDTPQPGLAYRYLKGTKYRNLIATRYPHLMETLESPAQEDSATQGSGLTNPAGATQTYTYSGTAYPVAYVTVSGTRLAGYPVYQNTAYYSFAAGAYSYSELAWTSQNTRISGGALSNNVILYGHNWGNYAYPFKSSGAQFEALMAFFDSGFASSNRTITLSTADGSVYTYRVFAVFFTRDLNFYIHPNNGAAGVAARAIAYSQSYGLFNSSYGGNKILTLSTCTRYLGNDANQRFVVMAELVG